MLKLRMEDSYFAPHVKVLFGFFSNFAFVMNVAAYQVIVVAVALYAVCRGFRAGLTRQVSGILGVAFGIVAARALAPDLDLWLRGWMPHFYHPVARTFFFSTLSHGVIFGICVLLCSMLTGVLNAAMSLFSVGILNSLFGMVFSLLKYLMFLSLLFDMAVCRKMDSPLLKCARHDDGNLVEEVMKLAPFVLGSVPSDEYTHHVQLWEAKKIS